MADDRFTRDTNILVYSIGRLAAGGILLSRNS
jgi:hypothetical protein